MEESTEKLRKMCQDWKKDRESKLSFMWYRPISIHITKLFLYTPITANQVTLFSVVVGILGGYFLALGSNKGDLLAFIMMQFFWILDRVDGEVSRYRKTGSITGEYIDYSAHYLIYSIFLIGMTLGAHRDIGNTWIFLFGFSAVLSSIFEKDIEGIMYCVVCQEKIHRAKKGIADKKNENILLQDTELSEEFPSSAPAGRAVDSARKVLDKYPRLKLHVYYLFYLVTGGICSEMGIMVTLILPVIADFIWGGMIICGTHYRFMTLYLMLIGALYPFMLARDFLKNVRCSMPDIEYRKLFGGD